ncbi:MAG: PRC-barrel domain-containing protein [Halanaerobiales bacterium]
MIQNLDDLIGYNVISSKGEDIGKVKDFYFDSKELVIRYAVVDTGGWLTGRKVLVSPDSFDKPDWKAKVFPVNLTKDEIEEGPSIDEEKPVSRQMEVELTDYYNWPPYWVPIPGETSVGFGGDYPVRAIPNEESPTKDEESADETQEKNQEENRACDDENCYLRSLNEVEGYNIESLDGDIGHVETLLASDDNWIIHYLVVDTRNWLPGKKVLISPEWLNRFSYTEQKVEVELHKDTIESSPEYDPDVPVTREYEEDLYIHYGKDPYW